VKRLIITLQADNIPDDLADDVIDGTRAIVAVWSKRNDYGGTWAVGDVVTVER
jgi:hypothetical protein